MRTDTVKDFLYEKDTDGVVTLTMDLQGKSSNTMNDRFATGMNEVLRRLRSEEDLAGVVLASKKKTFFAGGDLDELVAIEVIDAETFNMVQDRKALLRELEKLPCPVVAAINGAALGGGYEVALACNHRIIVNDRSAVTGLPEVTLGLLPGAGGVVRTTAVLGLEKALPVLLEGKRYGPLEALALGLVDQIVETLDELIPAAKDWILANPDKSLQPWEARDFVYPGGGVDVPSVRQVIQLTPATLFARTRGLSQASEKILDVAVNSMRMNFDAALRMETRAFLFLLGSPCSKAMINTFFFGMQEIKSGKLRPEGEPWRVKSVGVLGAGMMGAGIAWANASKGIMCALKDTSFERAEDGKAYSVKVADRLIKRGRMSEDKKAELLKRIIPADNDQPLHGSDVLIEAVFEDTDLKQKIIGETFGLLNDEGIYASNTSGLPITTLSESCPDPSRFIGLHFFSPVQHMKVVEIILGKRTSQETLRKAYDYVSQLSYLPIKVSDSRGFFTSRVITSFIDEAHALMIEGVKPVSIERACWKVGMPVGALAIHDEVSITLSEKQMIAHQKLDERLGEDSGYTARFPSLRQVNEFMLGQDRGGRHYGGGFYEYPGNGGKRLWAGLSHFEKENAVTMKDAEDRVLYRQVLETLRCLDENVLHSEVEANLGGIKAIGFPANTGGATQFIRTVGIEKFEARANELAETYGDRFSVGPEVYDRLRRNDFAVGPKA